MAQSATGGTFHPNQFHPTKMIIGNASGGAVGSIISTSPFRSILGNGGAAIAHKIMARRALRGMHPSLHTKKAAGGNVGGNACGCGGTCGGCGGSIGNKIARGGDGTANFTNADNVPTHLADEVKLNNPLMDAERSDALPDQFGAQGGLFEDHMEDSQNLGQAGTMNIDPIDEAALVKRHETPGASAGQKFGLSLEGWGSGLKPVSKSDYHLNVSSPTAPINIVDHSRPAKLSRQQSTAIPSSRQMF